MKLAEAFGAEGCRVQTPAEFEAALRRAFLCDGPYLIDCRIDQDEFVLPIGWKMNSWAASSPPHIRPTAPKSTDGFARLWGIVSCPS